MIQYNYQSKYLVTRVGNMFVYKYEKGKFDQPFLSVKPKRIFIGKSKVCPMTQFAGAGKKVGFDGNTLLLEFEGNENI